MHGTCEICGREDIKLERHHLIPRTRHRKKKTRKLFSREDVTTRILRICRTCHNQVHAVLTEKELAEEYNTLEKILAHPEVAKYAAWIRKRKPDGKLPVRKKKS